MTTIVKYKIWKGFGVWQFIDYDKKEVTTKIRFYGRNFDIPNQKEVK